MPHQHYEEFHEQLLFLTKLSSTTLGHMGTISNHTFQANDDRQIGKWMRQVRNQLRYVRRNLVPFKTIDEEVDLTLDYLRQSRVSIMMRELTVIFLLVLLLGDNGTKNASLETLLYRCRMPGHRIGSFDTCTRRLPMQN